MVTSWPRAYPATGLRAIFKRSPNDFQVDESLDFDLSGSGEHLYLFVEKRNLGTPEVAKYLAQRFGVRPDSIGYAGMKDKVSVARQWFSVHTDEEIESPVRFKSDLPGLMVLAVSRHERKLRRGQVSLNTFTVSLNGMRGEGLTDRLADKLAERMSLLARNGVPNYFGPQRFGTNNLPAARTWLEQRRTTRVSKFMKGLHLSVLRSFLFNEVLARRVEDGSWDKSIEGDVLIEGDPSAPLWGRGRSESRADALAMENAALAPHRTLCEGLEYAGVSQQRRAQVLNPESMSWEKSGDELKIRFRLPAGCYATSLLHECFDLA